MARMCFMRELTLAGHHRGVGEHVSVVRDINVDEAGRWPNDFSITLIGRDRLHVRIDRFLPAANANIDVRRHVHIVRETRLQLRRRSAAVIARSGCGEASIA